MSTTPAQNGDATKPATRGFVDRRIERQLHEMGEGVAGALAEIVKQLSARIDALEQRTANFRYVGTFEDGKQYEAGNFVTDAGSLFHCNAATTSKPGTDSSWTLAVKRGRDGKDHDVQHHGGNGHDPGRRSVRTHR